MNPSDRIGDDRLREILAGCEGVTPGPWHPYHDHLRPGMSGYIDEVQCRDRRKPIVAWGGFDQNRRSPRGNQRNAAHIARLDPQTVASIVSELLSHRARLAYRHSELIEAISPKEPAHGK